MNIPDYHALIAHLGGTEPAGSLVVDYWHDEPLSDRDGEREDVDSYLFKPHTLTPRWLPLPEQKGMGDTVAMLVDAGAPEALARAVAKTWRSHDERPTEASVEVRTANFARHAVYVAPSVTYYVSLIGDNQRRESSTWEPTHDGSWYMLSRDQVVWNGGIRERVPVDSPAVTDAEAEARGWCMELRPGFSGFIDTETQPGIARSLHRAFSGARE